MFVAGVVGIPIFFILLITIGPGVENFSNLHDMLDQVASYQFIGEGMPSIVVQESFAHGVIHILRSLLDGSAVRMLGNVIMLFCSVQSSSVEQNFHPAHICSSVVLWFGQ